MNGGIPPGLIHIGLPKTATSTLQNHLFDRHDQVLYLGRNAGVTGGYRDDDMAFIAGALRPARRAVGRIPGSSVIQQAAS